MAGENCFLGDKTEIKLETLTLFARSIAYCLEFASIKSKYEAHLRQKTNFRVPMPDDSTQGT